MEKPKIWPPPRSQPRMRESYKLAEVITSRTPTPVQKFVTICPGVSFPRMRDFACQIAHQQVLVFFGRVLATRYSQGPWKDFDAKYAKTRGTAQGCAFSGSRTKNLVFRPPSPRICVILGTIFDGTTFSPKKCLTKGMLTLGHLLIVIVDP